MTSARKPAKTTGKAAGSKPAPSFYRWQLASCQALPVSYDVIMAVLDDDRTYTIEEAERLIDEFLNRKV